MSARKCVYISQVVFAQSPPSPNSTVNAITTEIRVFYPPGAGNIEAARRELDKAYHAAAEELA